MIDTESQRIVEAHCVQVVVNTMDFAVLHHPLPWSDELEEEIQTMLMEEFAAIVGSDPDVAARADLNQVRTAMVAAFHDRLAHLSVSAEIIGNA